VDDAENPAHGAPIPGGLFLGRHGR
jgi:hypothetical protein